MKVRSDFVTNSSSSSFVTMTIDSGVLAEILKRFQLELCPDFLDENAEGVFAGTECVVGTTNLTSSAIDAGITTIDNVPAYVLDRNNKYLEYTFEVQEPGLYNISVNYRPMEDTGRAIQVGFMLDGAYPYKELENILLSSIYHKGVRTILFFFLLEISVSAYPIKNLT
jgi:hypothetical protein